MILQNCWHDLWIGSSILKELYPCLFLISLDKDATMAMVGQWVPDYGLSIWRWRRALFALEEELFVQLQQLLVSVILCRDGEDGWC